MKALSIAGMLSAILVLWSSSVFANTYVRCGHAVDWNNWEVEGYELELSTEGADDYSGSVGVNWNMKLGSEDAEWLNPNPNITAKNYKVDGDTIVEIQIVMGKSMSGPVGTRYVLTGLYDDSPRLEKFTMGGFAGSVKTGTFECFTGHD